MAQEAEWQYIDTYIDNDVIECPTCHNLINVEFDESVVTEHECNVCSSVLQLKHTVSHLTEVYLKREKTNGTKQNGNEEVSDQTGS